MKCLNCGTEGMKRSSEDVHYTDCGLPRIFLKGVTTYTCQECGESDIEIPNIEELHGLIARALASLKRRLTPEEIRFLRVHLGFSGKQFADVVGLSASHVSRAEQGHDNLGAPAERFLRIAVLAQIGAFRDYDLLKSIGNSSKPSQAKLMFAISKSRSKHWEKVA
jgi:putative transcriptional regulator